MTSYSEIIDLFYRRVERDRDYFLYIGQTPEECMALARTRALGYLTEALSYITMECHPTVDFFAEPDPDELEQFLIEKGLKEPEGTNDNDSSDDDDATSTDPTDDADSETNDEDSSEEEQDTYFAFELTRPEKLLVSTLMYRQHLERDIAYLKTLTRDYTATDLRVFSPSEARDSFMDMYERVDAECQHLMDIYKNTNREDGTFAGINFSAFDDEE